MLFTSIFFLFQQCLFSILPKSKFNFSFKFILSSANAFSLNQSKILSFGKELTLYQTILTFKDPKRRAFENIVGKGENAGYQHFLFFPQCLFSVCPKSKFNFSFQFILSSANAFNLNQSKIFSFGKELQDV